MLNDERVLGLKRRCRTLKCSPGRKRPSESLSTARRTPEPLRHQSANTSIRLSASPMSVIGSVPNQRMPSASPCTANSEGASQGKSSRNDSREVVRVGNVVIRLRLESGSSQSQVIKQRMCRVGPYRATGSLFARLRPIADAAQIRLSTSWMSPSIDRNRSACRHCQTFARLSVTSPSGVSQAVLIRLLAVLRASPLSVRHVIRFAAFPGLRSSSRTCPAHPPAT
ncbi:hypothetical protein AWB83_02324 [Caballeronia ptereochthonis]|uniref:Uncharacterized protein n=1 Tax=Caballeronia ptereochthonis TaxID=1777144 RepID=A0A158ATD7_9BURK|nr:hypothetical protein AWB83_02324 [Caballeronia ptereochthonis]